MTPERWKRIEAIYHRALQLPAEHRASFLDVECEGDVSLRREVESLLEEGGETAGFMERPAMQIEAESIAKRSADDRSVKRFPELGTRYELLDEAGRGGMGIVFRARDRETDEIVAVKVLRSELADKQMIDRFKTELKLARRVTHRNVCRIYDISRVGDISYISMEFVRGESLRRVLNRIGGLTVRKGADVVRQICEGLREAHAQGIIHRDLKPENIMLDEAGNVKIMDFGVARLTSSQTARTEGVIGTPAYMSPEQAEGHPVDQRSDIYSLGLVMYEIFTGRAAFSGDTPIVVALKQIRETPPDPRSVEPLVPEDLERVILKCLEKNPQKRFQNLSELQAAMGKPPAVTPAPIRTRESSKILSWFNETDYILAPAYARVFLIFIQFGYMLLYLAALLYLDAATRVLQQLGVPYVRGLQILIPAAIAGISIRIFLLSALSFNHPATGTQFWRLFPILVVLDEIWAAAPLLLAPRIGMGLSLACTAGMAYLPFSQKTLIWNAYRT
jgi:hypothetical protein